MVRPDRHDGNRISIAARAPVLLGELSECNRRRILCDPASKFIYTGIVGHGLQFMRVVRYVTVTFDAYRAHLADFIGDCQHHDIRAGVVYVCDAVEPLLGRAVAPVPTIADDAMARACRRHGAR